MVVWQSLKEAVTKPLSMFFLGIFIALLATTTNPIQATHDTTPEQGIPEQIPNPYNTNTRDIPSPQNYIEQEQIKVYQTHVLIEAENIKWAKFEDTKSMLPSINKDSYALQIEPQCPNDIEVGDIISYKSEYAEGIIIHRVVHKAEDQNGIYFILRGDNNPSNDPGRIRCEQIQRKLIAIIY